MAVGHLVAHLHLALLGHVYAHHLAHAGLEVHALVAAPETHGLDHDAALAGLHAEAGVLHLTGLLTEDASQQPLLGGRLALALEAGLTHQNVTGLDLGPDPDDAVLVKVAQGRLAQTRNITGDLLRPQLGVAGFDLILLDMDRCVEVLPNQAVGDADRVLEVEAVKGHDGDGDVLAQRQSAQVRSRAVGDDLALRHGLANLDDRVLVEVGALVAAGETDQVEGADVAFHHSGGGRVLAQRDLDSAGVHVAHHSRHVGHHARSRVGDDALLHARSHGGAFGAHQRHGLRLHVRPHQGAVGVVVLQKGNEAGVDAHDLLGRDVHVVHVDGFMVGRVALAAGQHALVDKGAVGVEQAVGLGNRVLVLDVGRHVHHVVGDLAAVHLAVRGHDEAQRVDLGVARQGRNQADVGTLRRFDGADAPVVRAVHVAHVESGALAGQPARPQRGDAALVTQVGQRVGLVLELAELAAPEKLAHGRHDGPVVHQLGGSRGVGVAQQHALAHTARHAAQAHTQLVGQQLAHRAHPAVAQVVDVVVGHRHARVRDHAVGVDVLHVERVQALHQRQQVADGVDQARVGELAVGERQQRTVLPGGAQLGVHLETARVAQVVAFGVGQQPEQVLDGLVALGRIAGTQHREQPQQRLVSPHACGLVFRQLGLGIELGHQ